MAQAAGLRFLHALRGIARTHMIAAVVTVPQHVWAVARPGLLRQVAPSVRLRWADGRSTADNAFRGRPAGARFGQFEHGCDAALSLRSFADEDGVVASAFKDFHGTLEVRKAFRIGVMAAAPLETCTWLFRLRRRRFHLEPLTLPPDLSASDSSSSSSSGTSTKGALSAASCATSIDF